MAARWFMQVLLLGHVTLGSAKPSPNVPCKPMNDYMPAGMSKAYNISKHNGTWYEVSFRDLYPWGPVCDCQQSIKYVNAEQGYIDDYFVFTCYPAGWSYISPQRENMTNASSGKKHMNGVADMSVRYSDFSFITHYEWNTEFIGYKDDGKDQYKWIIEYQCGTRPNLPNYVCAFQTKEGHCEFTGVQLFVRDRDNIAEGRKEMVEYLKSLGPTTSGSEAVAWVMSDFGAGTFPPFFVNDTWKDDCPKPCESGVYNETTKMWGCPKEHKGKKLRIANPLDFDGAAAAAAASSSLVV